MIGNFCCYWVFSQITQHDLATSGIDSLLELGK